MATDALKARINALSHGGSWSEWPWQIYKSPLETLRVQPTFAACEWIYRLVTWACAAHAHRTGNWQLFFSSFMCGSFNDAFFMAMPFADNFWQSSNAAIYLTPRMPVYIVEMRVYSPRDETPDTLQTNAVATLGNRYAVIMYASTTAARRWNLPYASEAALTGLLAHFLYGTYDINGPRYLWWTWHDSDPAIGARQLNAPIGSSVWILTYCAIHAAVNRWTNDASASLTRDLVQPLLNLLATVLKRPLPATLTNLATSLAAAIDRVVHARLVNAPSLLKIVFTGSVCTPLFMMAMGQFQIFSLDIIGVPGQRTYRFALALYAALLARAAVLKQFNPLALPTEHREANFRLLSWLSAFYAVQLTVAALGKPKAHLVTGCHQRVAPKGKFRINDIMGFEREDACACATPETGGPPELNSRYDYAFAGTQEAGTYDANGRKIVPPNPADSVASEWYTIRGVERPKELGGRAAEVMGVGIFTMLGMLGYGSALSS